jgi:lysophospholipase L1-like esterase
MEKRICVWAPAQQLCEEGNLPPSPGLKSMRLRQNFRVSLGGRAPRLRLSNLFGDGPLGIGGAVLAPSRGMDCIDSGAARPLLFGGRPELVIPAGSEAWSDPLEMDVGDQDGLSLTIQVDACPTAITAHPGSRTTSFIAPAGDLAEAALPEATRVEHWYFISAMEVIVDEPCACLTAIGDSITDGRGSVTDGDTRWTDYLARRLGSAAGVAVVNAGLGGNRVLLDGLGPSAASRFVRDALEPAGTRWCVIFEGVNDIGTRAQELGAAALADELASAYLEMIRAAHARGVLAYGATITPFGGSQYDQPECREARRLVNEWIRAPGRFDALLDFDAVLRDPAEPGRLRREADTGDGLHLTPAGYRMLADSVDLGLFRMG